MKKRVCLILVFALLFNIMNTLGITGEAVTGEVITGEAAQEVGMNISVTGGVPALSILSPANTTYSTGALVLLNYSVSGEDVVWYNLDGLTNITITAPITFSPSDGGHVLYLYANNSVGTAGTSVSFYVTPSGQVESPAGGGGGGGGGAAVKEDFYLNKEMISVKLKQGETTKREVIIRNAGNKKIKIVLSFPKLEEFIRINERTFEIEAKKSKTITLNFIAREDAIPDLYMGKLIFKSDIAEKEILVSVEVESKKSLLDIELEIPKEYASVLPGEDILVKIGLTNLGEKRRIDVNLNYTIKDYDGDIIVTEEETLAIETTASIIRIIKIPEDTKYGKYVFYVKGTYEGEAAGASTGFSVGKKEISLIEIFLIILIAFVILCLFFIVYNLLKIKKHLKIKGKFIIEKSIKRKRR